MQDIPFRTSVFLSYPKPHLKSQEAFIDMLGRYLSDRGLAARTLGVTDYDSDAPLTAIRRLMLESNGLIAVGFARSHHGNTTVNPGADIKDRPERSNNDTWTTSIWSHVEPAMAYQLGLPILLLREKKVASDGMFERGVVGLYSPEFDLNQEISQFFESNEWRQIIRQWETRVNLVAENKGRPPQLY